MLISVWSSDVCSSDLADVGDEPAEMPRDLRVGGLIVVGSGRHGAGFAKLIDLDDVRDDAALHRLPYQRRRQAGCEHQAAERHEPPILCLHARRADAFVPLLPGALIGCFGFGRLPVALDSSFKSHGLVPFLDIRCDTGAAAIARLNGVDRHLAAVPAGLRRVEFLRSDEHTSELQSLMRISYAVFCLKKKIKNSE